MGAQPKKKTSKSKKNLRRNHDHISVGSIVLCSHCRRPHLAHHVCANCGYYAGRQVLPDEQPAATS
ncbi:MAG TPA: 50S ribosomal protein L32 [Chloroflexota bacterium]